MNSRERVAAAMHHERPDRVPVMCQLSLGHYFLRAGFQPIDIWFDSSTFAAALLRLQKRYQFDGVLINLPGRDPQWRDHVARIEARGSDSVIHWTDGGVSVLPADDLPYGTEVRARFEAVDPDALYYVEPYDRAGLTVIREFSPWQCDTIKSVRARAPDVSVHSEVFSPFTQLLELVGYTDALMTLLDDPAKVKACLDALCRGTTDLMLLQAQCGVDAVLISSAFAGAGFIGRHHYQEFVLPFEQRVIADFKQRFPDVPVYTHTCGAIGDRLDLMQETGTNGIDTLDPPPLGTVHLEAALRRFAGSLFLKGNMDPVNTLLQGSAAHVYDDAVTRLRLARDIYGYILSTSCSVAPLTSPENIGQLVRAANDAGRYS